MQFRQNPWETGGSLLEKQKEFTEEEKKKLQEKVVEYRNLGLLYLRKSGAVVDFCTHMNRLRIVFDDVVVEYEDGKTKVVVEGHDIADHIATMKIDVSPKRDLQIMTVLSPLSFKLNDEPEEVKK